MTIPFKLPLLLLAFSLIAFSNQAISQTDEDGIKLNIFPNPNSGTFYITLVNDESYRSQLFSMDGQMVKTIYLEGGLNYILLDVPAGIYFLRVGEDKEQEQFKIVIK